MTTVKTYEHEHHKHTPDLLTSKQSNQIPTDKVRTPAVVTEAGADPDDRPAFELTVTQIVASTAAAVTAAVLGSRLGVAGTLVGAALATIVSVVGAAIYSHSIAVTRRRMKRALRAVRHADEHDDAARTVAFAVPILGPIPSATGTSPMTAQGTAPGKRSSAPDRPTVLGRLGRLGRAEGGESAVGTHVRPLIRSRRSLAAGVLVGAVVSAVIFAVSLLVVTAAETVRGEALSGGAAGNYSVLGGDDDPSTPAPVTVTETAPVTTTQVSPTTDTVTESSVAPGAPGATTPAAPTPTSTPDPASSSSQAPSTPATSTAGEPAPAVGATTPGAATTTTAATTTSVVGGSSVPR